MVRKLQIAKKCDECGSITEQFLITASHKTFCYEGYIGKTTKYCLDKYLKRKEEENVRKEKEQKSLQQQRQERIQEEKEKKIKAYPDLNKKLDEFYDRNKVKKTNRSYL